MVAEDDLFSLFLFLFFVVLSFQVDKSGLTVFFVFIADVFILFSVCVCMCFTEHYLLDLLIVQKNLS